MLRWPKMTCPKTTNERGIVTFFVILQRSSVLRHPRHFLHTNDVPWACKILDSVSTRTRLYLEQERAVLMQWRIRKTAEILARQIYSRRPIWTSTYRLPVPAKVCRKVGFTYIFTPTYALAIWAKMTGGYGTSQPLSNRYGNYHV